MPKRPRQAHVPRQTRKRKARREPTFTPADAFIASPAPILPAGYGAREPAGPIPISSPRGFPSSEVRSPAVRLAGQLPTFEPGYLVDELRRIAITAGCLLLLIIALTLILR